MDDVIFILVILGFFALTMGYAAWCVGLVRPVEADPRRTGIDTTDIDRPDAGATADAPTGSRAA